jgi:carbonic anhydrase
MSCLNSSSPVDINKDNLSGNCQSKCSYRFQYMTSSCVATNRGDYISLSYDNTSNPSVIYNDSGYKVDHVRIYSPSIHTYNGKRADAELIIVHNSIAGLNPLLVCVPIKVNNVKTTDVEVLSSIIDTMLNNAPNNNETTNVNVFNYNMNFFVPKKPFYSYTGNLIYQPCGGKIDYVVFSPQQYTINISSISLERLQQLITIHPYKNASTNLESKLFYNEKGSQIYATNNDIYIDCQPVVNNTDKKDTIVLTQLNLPSFNITNILKNPAFQLMAGVLFFLLFFYVVSWIFNLSKNFVSTNGDDSFISKFVPNMLRK